jgi:DNA-3-methyladenine glycosylase II
MPENDLPLRSQNLSPETFQQGLAYLQRHDEDLRRVVKRFGPPPMWARQPGFPTLVWIILEQQVSLASARAAYERLLAVANPLTPERFLELDDASLKRIGFSRQKTGYCRELAGALLGGQLNLRELESQDDAAARAELMKVKGIGPWTADIYLLMALLRADTWPSGDLALAVGVERLKRLPSRPQPEELDSIGERWRPWRAVAARIVWHFYLSDVDKF